MDLGYRLITVAARAAFRALDLKLSYTGMRHVPDTGGAVVAINHTAHVDFLLAGVAVLRANGRLVRFMAKQTIWGHPVAGRIMRMCGHIPVDRAAGAAALDRAIEAINAGELVGVYPEGTLSRSFEIKDSFKTGAVRMARATGRPVLPTIVWGAQRIWTKDHPRNFTRAGIPVHVAFGEPMYVGPDEDVAQATARLHATMVDLHAEVVAGYPPMPPEALAFQPARLGGTAPTPEEAYDRDLADSRRTSDEWTR